MKRLVCASLAAFVITGLGLSTTPAMPTQSAAPRVDHLRPAVHSHHCATPQETWSFRVDLRTRSSPQSPWGPWQAYTTYTGPYGRALSQFNQTADYLNGLSHNNQTRIVEKRIR